MRPARSKALKLAAAARAAAEVRAYQTDPDVVALRVERVRGWVDRLIWTGMVLGLLFTMANVAHFAAGDAPKWSTQWTTAWLLDPMVSLVLIGVLMGEQIINRHGLKAGHWVRTTKWVALACTYAMNTWSAWQALDPAQILLHSVPPAIVFCAAEAVVTLRQQITRSVTVAYDQAAERAKALRAAADSSQAAVGTQQAEVAGRTGEGPVPQETVPVPAFPVRTVDAQDLQGADVDVLHEGAGGPRTERPRADVPHVVRTDRSRMVRTARPRTQSRTEGSDGVDRDGLVAELAEEIRAAYDADQKWRPDYTALRSRTGRGQRWCEYVVRDARNAVMFRTDETRTEVPQQSAPQDAEVPHGADASRTDDSPQEETRTEVPHGADADASRTGDSPHEETRTDDSPHESAPHDADAIRADGEWELVTAGGGR